jgi:hypothetical protein
MAQWLHTEMVCQEAQLTANGVEADFEVGALVELLIPHLVRALVDNEELRLGIIRRIRTALTDPTLAPAALDFEAGLLAAPTPEQFSELLRQLGWVRSDS